MQALFDWLNAHPALVSAMATTVVIPLLTAFLSFALDGIAKKSPTTAALLRAGGFDAARFVSILFSLARGKVPALPVPPEVMEQVSRRGDVSPLLLDADKTPVTRVPR